MGYAEAAAALYAGVKAVTAGHGGRIAQSVGNRPAPGLPRVPPMPDINAQNQAGALEEAKAAAIRQGRASTILTTPQTSGDQLGP